MQVCHGKAAPLRRLRGGDWVVYYAPTTHMGSTDRLQSFVSLGVVQAGDPYQADMGGGFMPFRRDVVYAQASPARIALLLNDLSFVEDPQRWGYKFRFGLFEIPVVDMRLIARSMKVDTYQLDTLFKSQPCAAPTDSLPLFS